MPKYLLRLTASAAAAAFLGICSLTSAQAQNGMFQQPYQNPNPDRASLAVVMKQVQSGWYNKSSSSTSSSSGGGQALLCGGASSTASASGNSSCIIIGSGATANIGLGQATKGDQSATSKSTQTQNSAVGDAAAVESILNGGGG